MVELRVDGMKKVKAPQKAPNMIVVGGRNFRPDSCGAAACGGRLHHQSHRLSRCVVHSVQELGYELQYAGVVLARATL